jgi:CheY-like chemotaxis protein
MQGSDRATWFAGDLSDPWVVEIADALPRGSLRIDCPDDLPETWPIDRPAPLALILHRSKLTPTDAQRLARLKARSERPIRVVLCVGPHARYVDVERWSRLVDVVLPEATACETVQRQALAMERKPRPGPRSRIAIASTNHEMRAMLVEAARSGGYAVEAVSDPVDVTQTLALAWDLPVLEPDWPSRLASLARSRPVLALFGFADRQLVAQARLAGASACLDLPCDVADFVAVLDRIANFRLDSPHQVPAPPSSQRKIPASQMRKN